MTIIRLSRSPTQYSLELSGLGHYTLETQITPKLLSSVPHLTNISITEGPSVGPEIPMQTWLSSKTASFMWSLWQGCPHCLEWSSHLKILQTQAPLITPNLLQISRIFICPANALEQLFRGTQEGASRSFRKARCQVPQLDQPNPAMGLAGCCWEGPEHPAVHTLGCS